MSTDRELARIVRSWLHEDAHEDADRILDLVLDQIDITPQRRAIWWPVRRLRLMSRPIQIALAAVLLAVVAFVGYRLLPGNVGAPPPSPTSIPTLEVGAGALLAGPYQITSVDPFIITITLPDSWESNVVPAMVWSQDATKATVAYMTVDDLFVDPCNPAEGYLGVGPTVDDLAGAVATYPGLTVNSTTAVTVSGFSGTLLSLSATDIGCGGDDPLWMTTQPGSIDRPSPGAGSELREILILDVGGERLVIDRHVPGGAEAARMDDVVSIVDSTVIDTP